MPGTMIEVRFTVPLGDVPGQPRAEAEVKAREAFVLSLLRQGQISAGRAAEVLGIDRWGLGDLMSAYGISPFDETITREELEREVADLAS
jgi:predicted HTH domain antitoxin